MRVDIRARKIGRIVNADVIESTQLFSISAEERSAAVAMLAERMLQVVDSDTHQLDEDAKQLPPDLKDELDDLKAGGSHSDQEYAAQRILKKLKDWGGPATDVLVNVLKVIQLLKS